MYANQVADIIAHFIGMFDIADEAKRIHTTYDPFEAPPRPVTMDAVPGAAPRHQDPHLGGRQTDPHISLADSEFAIHRVHGGALHPGAVKVALPVHLHHGHPHPHHHTLEPIEAPTPLRALHHEIHHPDAVIDYLDGGSGSVVGSIRQVSLLDDHDVFNMSSGEDPLAVVETVAASLKEMVATASDWSHAPGAAATPEGYQALLRTSAAEDGSSSGGDGATAHDGHYVNGAAADAAPDFAGLLTKLGITSFEADTIGRDQAAPDHGTHSADGALSVDLDGESGTGPLASAAIDLGGNTLANGASVLDVGPLGAASVVMGDYHETNSIRQLNVYADNDGAAGDSATGGLAGTGFAASSTEAYNSAYFHRVETGPTTTGAATPPAFASGFTVTTIAGDVLVTNILRQVHIVSDDDQAVLTSVDHSASVSLGGNVAANAIDFAALSLNYSIVIFGGSVFEGNYLEQINVLMDNDALKADAGGTALATTASSGNLLFNSGSITNVGSTDHFQAPSDTVFNLVKAVSAGDGTIDPALGPDLSFLGSGHHSVLYVTGNYYELNVVSQLNILSDADTVATASGIAQSYTDAAGGVPWTVSTGGNALVNSASIVDVDDAGHTRFLNGHYYSDSMLAQANIVTDPDGIQHQDTQSFVPELIAFTNDETAGPHGSPDMHHQLIDPVGHADGVAGVLT